MTSNSIIVKGFGNNIDQNDIKNTFSFCGKIIDSRMIEIENQRSCIVAFDSPSAVSIALLLTNGKLKDSIIKVEEYKGEYEKSHITHTTGSENKVLDIDTKLMENEYEELIPSNRSEKPNLNHFAFIHNLCPTLTSKSFVKYFSICGQIEAYKIDRETQTALIKFSTANSVDIAQLCSGTVLGQQDIHIEKYNPNIHGLKLYNYLYDAPINSLSDENRPHNEVLKQFKENIIKIPLTRIQRKYYMDIVIEHLEDEFNLNSLFDKLLKCCKHPFSIPQQSFLSEIEPLKRRDKIIKWSGKYRYLDEILPALYENNKQVLFCSSDEKNMEIFYQYISTYNYPKCNILDSKDKSSFIYTYRGEYIKELDIPKVDIVICFDPEWNMLNNPLINHIRNIPNSNITFYRLLSEFTLEECLYKFMSNFLDKEKIILNLSLLNKDMILRYSVYTFFLCNNQFSENNTEGYKEMTVSYDKSNFNFQPSELPHGKLDIRDHDFWIKFRNEVKALFMNKVNNTQSFNLENSTNKQIHQIIENTSNFDQHSNKITKFDDLIPTDDYIVTIEKINPESI